MKVKEENLLMYNPNDNGCGIYIIKSVSHPERCYVGSAVHLYDRLRIHLFHLESNSHHSIKLQRHFNKYGKNDLYSEVLERFVIAEKQTMLSTEQGYLDKLNPYFNICKIAGNRLGDKQSEESKEKCRQANIGEKNHNYGKHQSPETIEKRVSQLRGKPTHPNSRKALIDYLVGHVVSEETREKLRQHNLGKPSPNKGKILGSKTDEQYTRWLKAKRRTELLKSIGLTKEEWLLISVDF